MTAKEEIVPEEKLASLSFLEAREEIKKGKFSLSDLVSSFKKRIERRNGEVNAIISTIDYSESKKDLPLHGAVFVFKDNIAVKGEKCTAGSNILKDYISPFDATVTRKIKESGGVIIGKANMDEFAMGSSTETSFFGPTKNPISLSRVPGGSSGGSAAATADFMCNVALGSDTGGSVRQPAAFCGVVGMKPTYGVVSRNGVIAMASSFDQISPFARTVSDAEAVFNVIRGKDIYDSTTASGIAAKKTGPLKVGIPKEYFVEGVDKGIRLTIDKAISKIKGEVEEISLPHTEYALPAYYIIMASEVSSNMARFDGIRYGAEGRHKKGESLLETYLNNRAELIGSEVKRRMVLGTYSLSSGYYDAYYLRAQKVRSLIIEDFQKAFKKVDVILTPTTPNLPFEIGEKIDDPVQMYLSDIFTVTAGLAGVPAISLPCGEWEGLPVGAQIIAPRFSEENLFREAKVLEKIWWN